MGIQNPYYGHGFFVCFYFINRRSMTCRFIGEKKSKIYVSVFGKLWKNFDDEEERVMDERI